MRSSFVVSLVLSVLAFSCTTTEPTPSLAPATQATSVAVAPSACRVERTSNAVAFNFVAIAERPGDSVALFLDASTGAVQGRIANVGSLPEAAVDPTTSQLALLCESTHELVMYDMTTLAERWRVLFEDPQQTKAVGGSLTLAFSRRGDLVYAMHIKALQSDATAVGGSRYWMSVHDAGSGRRLAVVELAECGLGRLLGDGQGVTYVLCKEGLRAVDVTSWTVVATAPVDSGLRPVALLGDSRVIGVTADLRVKVFDASTGDIHETRWSDSGRSLVSHFGRLAVSADGTRVLVMTRTTGNASDWPDTTTEIDLAAGRRTDYPMADVRGTGYIGGRRLYFEQGLMRSADGTLNVSLLTGAVIYWTLLGKP